MHNAPRAGVPDEIVKLIESGVRVFPLEEGTKDKPLIKAWEKLASKDPAVIARWARLHPGCNWGAATGYMSGVFVVDIDVRHDGLKHWQELINRHGACETVMQVTGSGGYHLLFKYPVASIIKNNASGKVAVGVDVRGEGGYIVVAPSTHPDTGRQYAWAEGLAPWQAEFGDAPQWLLALAGQASDADDFKGMGEPLEPGERNASIYHQSLALARQGLDEQLIVAAMQQWLKASGKAAEGFSDEELVKTIQSAMHGAERKAEPTEPTDYTDTGNANRLIADAGDQVLHATELGWFVWTGKVWRLDTGDKLITERAKATMQRMRDAGYEKSRERDHLREGMAQAHWATASLNVGRIHAMIELAASVVGTSRVARDFDPPSSNLLLCVDNGTLDLDSDKLRPHAKSDMITRLCPVAYKPGAKCPFWLETLSLAFDGNDSLISYFKRAIGYSITGLMSEQCVFFAWGEDGNNGKTTMLETLASILGEYSTMVDISAITTEQRSNLQAMTLADMRGARLVSMNESEEGQRLSQALVKQMTGGDTVTARRLYQEQFNYVPTYKIWVRTNHKPIIHNMSDAIWRRIKLIPFNKSIPPEKRRPRHEVDAMLFKEREGILAWIVEGYREWRRQGLDDPAEVKAAVAEYKSEMDIVDQFFDAAVKTNATSRVDRTDMYHAFEQWTQKAGIKYSMNALTFAKRVGKRLNQQERGMVNGRYVWSGVELTDDAAIDLSGGFSRNGSRA